MVTHLACAIAIALQLILPVDALNAYGHAFSRPNDFTEAQYRAIASNFTVFTVEKATAAAIYGNGTNPPFKTNSIAASIGVARKLKAINPRIKVLMYWNSALFFNFYECESEVQNSWLIKNPNPAKTVPFYNYAVPEFRNWWVRCAVQSVKGSNGTLDGLFLDATPRVAEKGHISEWGQMVDSIRKQLGEQVILIENGFYLAGGRKELSGLDEWRHSGSLYAESLANYGGEKVPIATGIKYLQWLSSANAKFPQAGPNKPHFIGHGHVHGHLSGTAAGLLQNDTEFQFGLCKYLMVTSSVRYGWFIANNGYGIDQGLLEQPASVYDGDDGIGCGEPTAPFKQLNANVLVRAFERGTVRLNFLAETCKIDCGPTPPAPP